jgi:hypothetical protein
MIEKEYTKKCEPGKLDKELRAAGFDIYGVSWAGSKTIIHLKDTETKDPTPIVEAHVYEEPKILPHLGILLSSPDGTIWILEVSNTGVPTVKKK